MKHFVLTLFLGLAVTAHAFAQIVPILPIPQKVELSQKTLRLNRKLTFRTQHLPHSSQLAINRLITNWEKKTLSKYLVIANEGSDIDLSIQPDWKGQSSSLEEYELKINDHIQLKAKTNAGLLHAFESLAQLIQSDEQGYFLPNCMIADWPRFAHRGLMIDVARHFIPVDVMLRSIDAMAASKLNVLHLHLSDDEGFRIESKKYPNLHLRGSNGSFYSQEEMRKIVKFASDREILVIPEFDLPGHSQSWFVGYPELASEKKEYQLGPRFVIEEGKPMNPMALTQMINSQSTPTINPTEKKTYQFLENFFKEMMELFPGPYFHVGMDENNGIAWKKNPTIQAFMKSNHIANEHDLQAYFGERLNLIVKKLGKKTVMWEEGFHQNLSENVAVQLWKPALMGKVLQAEEAALKNHQVIVSRGFYLDYFMPAAFHYLNTELLDLKNDQWVIGGEAAIWTELVDQNNFETRTWPRAVAVAARLWSSKEEKDLDKFYERLPSFDKHLTSLGLEHQMRSEAQLSSLLNQNLSDSDKQFFQLVAPLKGFKRLIGTMTQATALKMDHFSAFADILPSDSELKWEFRKSIKIYLQDPSNSINRTTINDYLKNWVLFDKLFSTKQEQSYQLKKILPMAKQISHCSQLVLNFLNSENAIEKSQILAEISKLKKMNVADLECVIADELEALVNGKLKDIDLKLSFF